MALTVHQEPNQLNAAYTNLIYTIESDLTGSFQFQYVMDVISGSERLARIRQYPNPNGVAVFDPSQIMTDYLQYHDYNMVNVEGLDDLVTGSDNTLSGNCIAHNQIIDFTVRFGEEYGTSPSSSVTLYDGNGNQGNTGVTGSNSPLTIFPAQVDYNAREAEFVGAKFDFYTGSRKLPGDTSQIDYGYNSFLSAMPNYEETRTTRGADEMGIDWNDTGCVQFLFSASADQDCIITAYAFPGENFLSTKTIQGPWPKLITLPVSPKQMGLTESEFYDDHTRFRLHVRTTNSAINKYFNIWKDEDACHYGRIGIQFINRLGAWDYYGFSLPTRENITVERDTYQQTFVDYGTNRVVDSPTFSRFIPELGGTQTYNTSTKRSVSVTTPYLSQAQAGFVEQIMDSPKIRLVYNRVDDTQTFPMNPKSVVLTNSSFTRNTNKRGQKLFQYTFDFDYSNNPQGR